MPDEWAMELLLKLDFEELDGKTNLTMQYSGIRLEIPDECKRLAIPL